MSDPASLPIAATFASIAADLAERLAAMITVTGPPLTQTAAELRAALPDTPDPQPVSRLQRLVAGLRLSPFERDLIVLAGLVNEHERLADVLGQLHPAGTPAATPAVAGALLCQATDQRPALVAALSSGPLIGAGLVRLGPGPFFTRTLELPPALWETLRGLDCWPPGLIAQPIPPLLGAGGWQRDPAVQRAVGALRTGTAPGAVPRLVLVTADDAGEARARAGALCRWAGARAREVRGDLTDPDLLRLAGLLCLVRGEVPVLAAADLAPAGSSTTVAEPLPEHPGPVLVCREPGTVVAAGGRPLIAVQARSPALAERVELWDALLPGLPAAAAELAVHRVGAVRAAEAVADARDLANAGGAELTPALVVQALHNRARHQLPHSVRLVRPSAPAADLVLDRRSLDLMDAALARCRHQVRVLQDWGLQRDRPGAGGVRLLFTGPPGTGKTYAAEVFAARLGLDLLVVDLSALVSKWLGETEKNLAAVFDAAEQSQAVLFFDEADAIFARRTETADAHARWANLETAYLLGRIEQFAGITLLATNLRANIDTAFGRRLDYVISFDEPDVAARERLWREHMREPAPIGPDVSFELLAQLYPVTGGVIRNAALAAAFMAAAGGGPITAGHVFTAVQREYEKAGRSFPGRPQALRPAAPERTEASISPHPAPAGAREAEFHGRKP
ncbi:ATP-binding protein [Kribbella sp. NPDC051952]|uniref:ATP-binding protein n=1 Tax=Kribbella sp. NPDC051952 TaxID=3154851 RepID=UPI003425C09B